MPLRITRGVSGTEGIEPERHRQSYRYGALDAENARHSDRRVNVPAVSPIRSSALVLRPDNHLAGFSERH